MIAIMGSSGVGKSTIATILSHRMNWALLKEPVEDNPYLGDYYRYPERYAFAMQIFMLHSRFQQARQYADYRVVSDTSMWGNDVFAQLQHELGYMSDVDYATYRAMSKTLISLVKPPELMVYLKCNHLEMLKRILNRRRAVEMKAPTEYWLSLINHFDEWYEKYDLGKKIMIDVSNIDVVDIGDDEDWIVDAILEAY